ncbi:MAG: hypothetical protein ABWX59_06770 [Microbacteriaceae bacterium]
MYLGACDTGIDDAVTLLWLLGDPGIDLAAITVTFGNVTAALAADNDEGPQTGAGGPSNGERWLLLDELRNTLAAGQHLVDQAVLLRLGGDQDLVTVDVA